MRKLVLAVILVLLCLFVFLKMIMGERLWTLLDSPTPYNDTKTAVRGVQAPTPVNNNPDLAMANQ